MDDDVTLAEVDEAIRNVRAALVSAAKDSRTQAKCRARIDELLEARMTLTRDLPVFSG